MQFLHKRLLLRVGKRRDLLPRYILRCLVALFQRPELGVDLQRVPLNQFWFLFQLWQQLLELHLMRFLHKRLLLRVGERQPLLPR
jgi:hypothetical protein